MHQDFLREGCRLETSFLMLATGDFSRRVGTRAKEGFADCSVWGCAGSSSGLGKTPSLLHTGVGSAVGRSGSSISPGLGAAMGAGFEFPTSTMATAISTPSESATRDFVFGMHVQVTRFLTFHLSTFTGSFWLRLCRAGFDNQDTNITCTESPLT
jgi:hypothetical protein